MIPALLLPPLPELSEPWASLFMELANTAIVVGVTGCLLFVIFYQRLANWRSTALGRNVMAFMACLLMLVIVGLIRAFVPYLDSWVDVLRFVAYSITACVVWNRVYLLVRYQTREEYGGDRDPHSESHPEPTPPDGVPTARE